jgi:hypothetical protein
MKQEYTVQKFSSGMHFIRIDSTLVDVLTDNGSKRVICRLNDQVEFHCAFMPKKEGGYFVNIGSPICKKLKIQVGAIVSAAFLPDNAEFQFDMPEELQEILRTDADADRIFRSLTEGNQRGLMYLVAQVKSTDKRIERAIKIASKLKHGVTSPRVILK